MQFQAEPSFKTIDGNLRDDELNIEPPEKEFAHHRQRQHVRRFYPIAGITKMIFDGRGQVHQQNWRWQEWLLQLPHPPCLGAGLYAELAGDGAVRLAPAQELHHEDELRQMFIEVVPASHELSS